MHYVYHPVAYQNGAQSTPKIHITPIANAKMVNKAVNQVHTDGKPKLDARIRAQTTYKTDQTTLSKMFFLFFRWAELGLPGPTGNNNYGPY